jgi:hypothetical protein
MRKKITEEVVDVLGLRFLKAAHLCSSWLKDNENFDEIS